MCVCVWVCACVCVRVCVCVCVSMMWGRKRKMITHGLDLSPCSSTLEIVDLMFWATFAVLSQLNSEGKPGRISHSYHAPWHHTHQIQPNTTECFLFVLLPVWEFRNQEGARSRCLTIQQDTQSYRSYQWLHSGMVLFPGYPSKMSPQLWDTCNIWNGKLGYQLEVKSN